MRKLTLLAAGLLFAGASHALSLADLS